MTDKPRIATKAELLGLVPKTKAVPMPELGPGVEILVSGYTVKTSLDVFAFAVQNGELNQRNDRLMSILKAVVDPPLSMEDSEAILAMDDGVADKILETANELNGRKGDPYEAFTTFFQHNRYALRVWTTCANVFHCLPSDLSEKSEEEFNMMLAALEVEAEQYEEARKSKE